MGGGGGGRNEKTTRKYHEIKRSLTLTFTNSLENAKGIGIFHCHPEPSNFSIYVT